MVGMQPYPQAQHGYPPHQQQQQPYGYSGQQNYNNYGEEAVVLPVLCSGF